MMLERDGCAGEAAARTAALARAMHGAAAAEHALDRGRGLGPEAVLAELPAAWSAPDQQRGEVIGHRRER
jgi:hypothetical protein